MAAAYLSSARDGMHSYLGAEGSGAGLGAGLGSGDGVSGGRVPRSFGFGGGGRLLHSHSNHHNQHHPSQSPGQSTSQGQNIASNSTANTALLLANDESERLFNEGLSAVQEAFDRRTARLQAEILEWRQNYAAQRDNITSLENENAALNLRVAELEATVQSQTVDIKQLVESKSIVTEKYNLLKKSAAQLDSFRKNIVSMVEYGPGLASALTGLDINQSFNISESTPSSADHRHSPTRQFSNYAKSSSQGPVSPSSNRVANVSTSGGSPYRDPTNAVSSNTSHRNTLLQQQYQQHHQYTHIQPTQSLNHQTFGSILEGPSFLNTSDMKSFEMSAQPLDYSLALPNPTYTDQATPAGATIGRENRSSSQSDSAQQSNRQQEHQNFASSQHSQSNSVSQQKPEQSLQSSPVHNDRTQQSQQVNSNITPNHAHQEPNLSSSLTSKSSSVSTPNLLSQSSRSLNPPKTSVNGSLSKQPQPLSVHTTASSGSAKPIDRVNRRNSEAPSYHPTFSTPVNQQLTARPAPAATPSPAGTSKHDPSPASAGGPIDAPTLYKQIREALSQSEFEAFAGFVAGFNAGDLSADDAVRSIGRVVRDRGLFSRMRTLIYTALAESSRGTEAG
ncbi:hypothetical protein BC830DRAFT_1089134 [Chytriomyces sp. MP71]|nr:hypothetical protein BC830DRAFT_1089134 [Chytriomyces sp. MP71]